MVHFLAISKLPTVCKTVDLLVQHIFLNPWSVIVTDQVFRLFPKCVGLSTKPSRLPWVYYPASTPTLMAKQRGPTKTWKPHFTACLPQILLSGALNSCVSNMTTILWPAPPLVCYFWMIPVLSDCSVPWSQGWHCCTCHSSQTPVMLQGLEGVPQGLASIHGLQLIHCQLPYPHPITNWIKRSGFPPATFLSRQTPENSFPATLAHMKLSTSLTSLQSAENTQIHGNSPYLPCLSAQTYI